MSAKKQTRYIYGTSELNITPWKTNSKTTTSQGQLPRTRSATELPGGKLYYRDSQSRASLPFAASAAVASLQLGITAKSQLNFKLPEIGFLHAKLANRWIIMIQNHPMSGSDRSNSFGASFWSNKDWRNRVNWRVIQHKIIPAFSTKAWHKSHLPNNLGSFAASFMEDLWRQF